MPKVESIILWWRRDDFQPPPGGTAGIYVGFLGFWHAVKMSACHKSSDMSDYLSICQSARQTERGGGGASAGRRQLSWYNWVEPQIPLVWKCKNKSSREDCIKCSGWECVNVQLCFAPWMHHCPPLHHCWTPPGSRRSAPEWSLLLVFLSPPRLQDGAPFNSMKFAHTAHTP